MSQTKTYLFSIDLEDVRRDVENGHQYRDAVVSNTKKYLDWLARHNAHCTFFTVGEIAVKYPELIQEIQSKGHELACHSMHHIPLDKLSPEEFDKDLEQNIEALIKAGAKEIKGFRAPVFSLTENTGWAYPILKKHGITYSSSVLAANNPLYGWKEFGEEQKEIEGVWEIPVSLASFGPKTVPFAGGVYFRVLPWFFTKNAFKNAHEAIGYFHPYDLDEAQENFMHAGINNSRFFNHLMFRNRAKLLPRLDVLMKKDWEIVTYQNYLKNKAHV